MDDLATSRGFGGKLGGRIAALTTQARVATAAGMAGHHANLAMLIQEKFFGLTGSELRRTIGPLYTSMAGHEGLHPDVAATLKFVGGGQGQLATLLGNQITGAAMGTGLVGLLTNELAPITQRLIAANPHLAISVSDAAQARARGLTHGMDMVFEAAQQGIPAKSFDVLTELARPDMDVSMIIDSYNRGLFGRGMALAYLAGLGYRDADTLHILDLASTLHTPQALADLVTFGVLPEADAAQRANKSGMSTEDFHLLVLGNGQPPSTTDLLEGYRRGFIDKTRLERGITQGPVRNEWFDLIEKLRYSPMSVADAVEAAVQGHITIEQSKEYAQQNGLEPEHWQALYDTAGNPPGVQAMVSMWHRGIMTRDELVAGIKESRLKNKYIDKVIDAGEALPPTETITSMYHKGSITAARAADLLLKRGYAPDIAHALLDSAHVDKATTVHELTQAQIVALYEDRGVSRDTAVTLLGKINYPVDVATTLLTLADARAAKKLTDAAISRVHSGFLAGRIDEPTAATDMDALRVPPDQRDALLALWEIEASIPTHRLSEAQLRAAAKRGLIGWADYTAELVGMGYAQQDADLLTALYQPSVPSTQEGQS